MVYYILPAIACLILFAYLYSRKKRVLTKHVQANNTWSYYDTVLTATASIRSEMDRTIIFPRVVIDSENAPMISFSFGRPLECLTAGTYKVVQVSKGDHEVHILAGAGLEFFYSIDDSGWLELRKDDNRIMLTGHNIKMGLGGYPPGSYATVIHFNLSEFQASKKAKP